MKEKTAIILLGLPLSGKTTWINDNKESLKNYQIISADEIKESHPDYNPNKAYLLHQYSVKRAEELVYAAAEIGENILMDGGGINNSYTIRIMNNLKWKNYRIKLVHIKTPYSVCLERNKTRERKVPEKAITDKALKEVSQFHKLSELSDVVEVVDYFTNSYIFVDMDGVIAAQSVLPIINNEIDFVNGEIHKWQAPVNVVIEKLYNLQSQGKHIFILSATPNSFSTKEKNEWLDKYFDIDKDKRFFVNQGKHKAEMLDNLVRNFKMKKEDILLVDDIHQTLYEVRGRGMNSMHISEFLTHKF